MNSYCEKNQQPNVLLVTLQAQGHLNPILTLGKCLVSKGLNVTLATITNTVENRFCTRKSIDGVHLKFFSDGLPGDYDRRASIDNYMDAISKFGPINLSALIRSHQSIFSCIISTPFTPWVADVAKELNVLYAMLWIQPCTVYHIYNRYYNRLDEFPTESCPYTTVKLPGLPEFSYDELPTFVLPSNRLRSFDSILNQVFHSMREVRWVFGNSFMELEKDVIMWLNDSGCNFRPVGPLVPVTLFGKEKDDGFDLFKSDGESHDCIDWLNKQKPSSVVYISFGTVLTSPVKELHSIATGLKQTNRPFLWVIRSPENQELKKFGFLEEIKEQGLIVRWCPQSEVLSHESVGCFLSHCGWNSLLESITAGVPVIGCPRWTDQPTNAKLVTDVWGVGVKMKKDSEGVFTADEVGRCVEEVMSGVRSEEFRRNALELKRAAREALADGGSSDNNIKMFVDEVNSFSLSYSVKE